MSPTVRPHSSHTAALQVSCTSKLARLSLIYFAERKNAVDLNGFKDEGGGENIFIAF